MIGHNTRFLAEGDGSVAGAIVRDQEEHSHASKFMSTHNYQPAAMQPVHLVEDSAAPRSKA